MGSKGSQTVTQQGNQTQTYTPNPAIGGAGGQAINMATTAAGAPFSQPVAPVAPFTPFQSIGFGETLGLQGMAQPYFNTAGNYLAGSAAPITGSEVANYYNPMADSVTRQMQNIFGQQNVQNTGNLVQSAGGVGADRVAVGQANMANQQALAAGQTYAGLYQQALAAAEQNKQMQAGAGFAFGQMGPAAQAAQQNAVNQLLGVGAQQQGLTQQQLNAIYQNQLAQIAYPFQTGQYLAGITAGLAPGMGGTTTGQYSGQTTYPSPSGLAQMLGLGAAGLGLAGQSGLLGGGLNALMPGSNFAGASAVGAGAPMGLLQSYGSGAPMGYNYGYAPSQTGYYGSPMYDEGGAVDPDYGDLAKREKYQEYKSIIPAAAQGNPAAETFLHDVGYDDGGQVVRWPHDNLGLEPFNIHQPGGYEPPANTDAVAHGVMSGKIKVLRPEGKDDGGSVDIPVGQASPMSLTIDPTNTGLPYPGAGKVHGSPIPQTQLPTGQGGKSGPYGQGMFFHPPPSMPQSGGQSPMGGGGLGGELGRLGQLGGSIGKLMGGMGGDAAAAGAGGFSAEQMAMLGLDFIGAADGGSVKGDRLNSYERGAELLRQRYLQQHLDPMNSRTVYDDTPTAGQHYRDLVAQKPDVNWLRNNQGQMETELRNNGPGEFISGGTQDPSYPRIAAGGAVDPMHPGEGYGDDDVDDVDFVPLTGRPTPILRPSFSLPPSVPMSEAPPGSVPEMGLGERAVGPSQPGHLLPGSTPAMAAPSDTPPPRAPMDSALPADVPLPRPNPLGGLTPQMREEFPALRSAAAERGVNFDIGEGYRSQERQNQLYAQGRTAPGSVVTDAPISNHTSGNAIDVVPTGGTTEHDVGATVADLTRTDPRFANMRSGSTFRGLYDPLHVELLGDHEARTPGGAPMGSAQMADAGPMGSAMRYGPMGPSRLPFPNATDPNSIARRWTMSPWAALTNAGVAMATQRGPIGSVLATGIGAAGKTFAGQQQELNSEQAINDKAAQLLMLAENHLRSYAHQDAELEETKRYHTAMMGYRASEQWRKIRASLDNPSNTDWVGRSEAEKDAYADQMVTRTPAQTQGPAPPAPGMVRGKMNGQPGWGHIGDAGFTPDVS